MNTTLQPLSDYQRAVLNELGILCWKKQDDSHVSERQEATEQIKQESRPVDKPRAETASKEAALSKLQQLKTQQTSVSYAGKVLCVFTPSADYSGLIKDIISALALNDCPLITLTQAELTQAKDYELVWHVGDTLSLGSKQLTTPGLSQFNEPALKKRLWQLIQSQLSI